MYSTLLFFHSWMRWFVLGSLLTSIITAFYGYNNHKPFTRAANLVRHWTATIAHIQLLLGILIYTKSPLIAYFWHNLSEALDNRDNTFFGIIHITLMLLAIIIITIGSAKAKRRSADSAKYKTMLVSYCAALAIIFIAIPWPFSPFAVRPLSR